MFEKKYTNIRHRLVKLTIYIVVAILILGATGYVGSFLYNNFYKTIVYSNEVMTLKKEWRANAVNIEEFEKIKERLQTKSQPRDINISANFY